MAERTKGELNFIDQYTRKLLVEWGDSCLKHGEILQLQKTPQQVYLDHALTKGWVSKKTPHKLTAKGWGTAAAFLRR